MRPMILNACPTPDELSGFLAGTCPPDEAEHIEGHLSSCDSCCRWCMEADVEDELLSDIQRVAGRDAAESSSARDSAEATPAADDPRVDLAETIEGFRIEKEIGRGGMGVVFLAEQISTKRRVALKVLLHGAVASESAKRRFEREVELAAHLDHPNIVTVLESGIASGRHFFAMQYVEGLELGDYVERTKCPLRETLTLFSAICRAVSYAHQRGIIHRDLKPSNIIVDQSGQPHILDFGLAKLRDADSERGRADRLLSMPGQPMGTLPYMSPEQTTGMQHELDIRTDVYSLGVILYRILTGAFPYSVVGDVHDVLRRINETIPRKPSALRQRLDDDVDTIVLKTLAKSRERRYQSADALADDVDRYLCGDPIEAKRDSTVYILRKLTRRHRIPLTIAVVMLALTTTLLVTTVRQGIAATESAARAILTALVNDPARAGDRIDRATPGVHNQAAASIGRMADSPSYTERITAARGGLLLDPVAFWKSVDGGPLWRNGEWLELCEAPELCTPEVLANIQSEARSGNDRRKYVAFCLLGQLADKGDSVTMSLCATAVGSEGHPGVAAAAAWALRRLSDSNPTSVSPTILRDELSGLRFVQLPSASQFRRGSDESDSYRFDDEIIPVEGVRIDGVYVAATEITMASWMDYVQQTAESGDEVRAKFEAYTGQVSEADRDRVAMGMISLSAGRRYCQWLSEQGISADPPLRYRLPSEDEWEYAARASSSARYCYGNAPKYTRFFANCDGNPSWHKVAQRMPNWFGLHDMHGGLWEWTASRYPPELAAAQGIEHEDLYVYRGGAYYSPAVRCRSAQRNYGAPDRAFDYTGLRIVMEFVQP